MIPTVIVDRDCECNAQAQVGVWRTWQHADTQARQLLLQPVCHVDVPVPAATPTRTAIERIVVAFAFVLSLSWHYLRFVFIAIRFHHDDLETIEQNASNILCKKRQAKV